VYTASCLCGGIRFEIKGELESIQICHCVQCRKAQGSAFVTNVPVKEANFNIVTGTDLLTCFESSPGKKRCFCKVCGSPIYSKTEKLQGVVRLRAGLIDGDLRTKPFAHFHVVSKVNWLDICDDFPQFTEGFVPKSKKL